MKIRFWVYLTVFLLFFSGFSTVSANELPEIPAMPALAPAPSLPSLDVFGTPSPPDILDNAEANMPGIEFWQEKSSAKKKKPQPGGEAPIDPLYAATFSWPVVGKITSGFGMRTFRSLTRIHEGIDIPVPHGTPIQAAAAGVVAEARTYRGYGHTVILDHKNGTKTLYAHCSSLAVKKGESVGTGQVVAYAGSTGRSSTSHLHFGVMVKGSFQNPIGYLKKTYQLAQKP